MRPRATPSHSVTTRNSSHAIVLADSEGHVDCGPTAPITGARALLLASHPHRLLSVKPDEFWGFHPQRGGQNMLAVLLMQLRESYVSAAAAHPV